MSDLESRLVYLINRDFVNPLFDAFVPILCYIGEYNISIVLALLLILVLSREKKMMGVAYLEALFTSGFIVFLLKNGLPRTSPFVTLGNIRQVMEENTVDPCFPSGHATCVFVTATVLSCYLRHGYLFYFLAIAAAIVRVYNGVHYVSDVAVGAVIGISTAYAAVLAVQKTKKIHRVILARLFGDTRGGTLEQGESVFLQKKRS
jgi:undecaprenyl-diphosphatase